MMDREFERKHTKSSVHEFEKSIDDARSQSANSIAFALHVRPDEVHEFLTRVGCYVVSHQTTKFSINWDGFTCQVQVVF